MTVRTVAKRLTPRPLRKRINQLFRTSGIATGTWRALPDFMIVGAQKAGTSSLFYYLQQHPAVRLPVGITKEIHYFDLHFDRGLTWYQGHFPLRTSMRRTATRGLRLQTFEATPEYMFHPLAPARIAATLPRMKAIMVLRNPIDRAYSHYNMQVVRGIEPLEFDEALAVEDERINPPLERIHRDTSYDGLKYMQYAYARRGVYIDQILAWRQAFPDGPLLVLDYAELSRDPAALYRRVLAFLELPPHDDVRLDNINEGSYRGAKKRMTDAARERLAEHFRPHNERLYAHLGQDLGWV
jgi:hypothetical protein